MTQYEQHLMMDRMRGFICHFCRLLLVVLSFVRSSIVRRQPFVMLIVCALYGLKNRLDYIRSPHDNDIKNAFAFRLHSNEKRACVLRFFAILRLAQC